MICELRFIMVGMRTAACPNGSGSQGVSAQVGGYAAKSPKNGIWVILAVM